MREGVRQFNVYLPTEVIRAVKYHAVDTEQSLSAIVERAVCEYLERHHDSGQTDSGQTRSGRTA